MSELPLIQIGPATLLENLAALDAALSGSGELFQFGGHVVYAVEIPIFPEPVTAIRKAGAKQVAQAAMKVAQFEKWNDRRQRFEACNCPSALASNYLAWRSWKLPSPPAEYRMNWFKR